MTWVPGSETKYEIRVACPCRLCILARDHVRECSTLRYPCPHVSIEPAATAAFLVGSWRGRAEPAVMPPPPRPSLMRRLWTVLMGES